MKAKALNWGFELLALCAAFLAPIHHFMMLVGVLVLADFVVGTWASVKAGQRISSRRMRETVGKILAYETAVVVGYLVDGIIGLPDCMVARVVSGFIGLTEAKSIFENLSLITGLDFWAVIMEKLKPALNASKEGEIAKAVDSKPANPSAPRQP